MGAMKFADLAMQEKIRAAKQEQRESDSAHGMRVWSMGQERSTLRPDWEAVKVAIMYRANRAKYAQYEDLHAELLNTGTVAMDGASSTADWQHWNGRIQTRIREELRTPAERDTALLAQLAAEFD